MDKDGCFSVLAYPRAAGALASLATEDLTTGARHELEGGAEDRTIGNAAAQVGYHKRSK